MSSYNAMTICKEIEEFLRRCTDRRYERYIDDYVKFIDAKYIINHDDLIVK